MEYTVQLTCMQVKNPLTFPTHPESASGAQPLPIKSFCAMALEFLLTGFKAIYITLKIGELSPKWGDIGSCSIKF